MLYCQEHGQVSDAQAYETWNMGQGMIIATLKPDDVQRVAQRCGIESKVIGQVSSKPGIRIKSKGLFTPNAELPF